MSEIDASEILAMDPVEYAGAIGHAAAGQIFLILAPEHPDGTNWIGSRATSDEEIALLVLELARYVAVRGGGGERLWRRALIGDLIITDIPENGEYDSAPVRRRFAFDMFATVTLAAHGQIVALQQLLLQAMGHDQVEPQPLRLEDSIFEPHGSLGDQEAYQAQWMKDQAAIDAAALEEQPEPDQVGAPDPVTEPAQPNAISVGATEEDSNAQVDAGEGQEAGDAAGADPGAQGEVPGVDADGLPPEGAGECETATAEPSADPEQLASPLAEQSGTEGGEANGAVGEGVNTSRRKSPN